MEGQLDFEKVRVTAFNISAKAFEYLVDEVQSIFDANAEIIDDIFPLAKFIIDRSSTVALLVQQDKLWDAEIIFRSVLEVLSKFLIITTQKDEAQLKIKLNEFWSQISDMEYLRYSAAVEKLVKHGNMNDIDTFKKTILTDEERSELESKVPKDKRKLLSNDWSFNGIILSLEKNKDLNPLIALEVLQFFWKMASHVAHGDKVGLNAIRLRDNVPNGREFRDVTQFLKLIKAVTTSCYWVAVQLALFVKDAEKQTTITKHFLDTNMDLTAIHLLVSQEAKKHGID
ncbi:DUF5677 domain-containing protein [Hymenobacter oligotrophus]|nr:DUF5677 domain-containing protein [Hymenobacter oligotrophus]